ncbi:MAG TPA: diguanylate cyclase [Candidatus Acidoferrales bacterium]|nr:diguanylate cyclase [Candidatus Acidoferrales bacterium]
MKILIAEDDAVSRRLLESFLRKWGYAVVAVVKGDDAWALLEAEEPPRLAILDWMMPGVEGVEICRRVRERSERPYTYMILLTARGHKQSLLAGLKAGADDYLSKPFDAEELRARLQVGERILKVQDELIAARDALHFQATHDLLTGVASRGAAFEFLARELARAHREKKSVGIVLADIDHFKAINDKFGHMAGDLVLQEIARRMTKCTRPYDCVGRYGGEEFLMIFPASTDEGILRLAERMRKAIEATRVRTPEGEIAITASFGVLVAHGSGHNDVNELLRLADAALYRAKHAGRNRVERADSAGGQQMDALSPNNAAPVI